MLASVVFSEILQERSEPDRSTDQKGETRNTSGVLRVPPKISGNERLCLPENNFIYQGTALYHAQIDEMKLNLSCSLNIP
jgi:hypothetical protein